MNKEKESYTVYEMAVRMNVSPPTIYRWIDAGLKFEKDINGRRVRKVITDDNVSDFLLANPELQ